MRQCIAFSVVLLLLPFLCPAQEIKLPVFFLRYDGGLGSEEIEPKEGATSSPPTSEKSKARRLKCFFRRKPLIDSTSSISDNTFLLPICGLGHHFIVLYVDG